MNAVNEGMRARALKLGLAVGAGALLLYAISLFGELGGPPPDNAGPPAPRNRPNLDLPSPPPPPPPAAPPPAATPAATPAPAPAATPAPTAPGRLEVFPSSLEFQVAATGAVRRTVTVANVGGKAIDGVGAARGGDVAFSVESPCTTLQPGQVCEVTVTYAGAPGGRSNGVVRVGGIGTAPVEVTLAGVTVEQSEPPPAPDHSAADRARLRAARSGGYKPGVLEPQVVRAPTVDGGAMLDPFGRPGSQPDYAPDLARVQSSLPVDSCRVVGADDLIEAVLQSTIDSRKCGEVRATVQRNVFGAAPGCRTVLIPSGSTLLGACEEMGEKDQKLSVRWRRLIRPDRAHIVIDQPAADSMGRPGLVGELDDRLQPQIMATVLSAVVQGGVAGAAAALDRSTATTVMDQLTGRVITSRPPSSPGAEAARSASEAITRSVDKLLGDFVEKRLDTRPIMVVPQGSLVTVIPSVDLWLRDPADGEEGRLTPVRPAPQAGSGAERRR